MQTKPLLYGLIGFFIGGLLVAIAATTFDKPDGQPSDKSNSSATMSMDDMTALLKGKASDAYDAAFISYMIEHHQSAVDMAKLSAENAKHDEIKQLSADIIAAQEQEISQMRQWQAEWGYPASDGHMNH